MADANYTVGQIVYVLMRKERSIVPMQIIEEITRRTRDGVEVAYRAAFGGRNQKGGHETVMLSELDAEVYADLDSVRRALIERATASVNNMVKSAAARAESWYDSKQSPPQPEDEQQPETAPNIIKLPDGTLARLRQ